MATTTERGALAARSILVIEDDEDIAFTTRLNLEREGAVVEHFGNGQEGLLAAQHGSFDFVVLDLNLPDLDGLTICRELRRDPKTASLPILMLTARTSERDRVTGLELGADDYLTKPFSMRELMARIQAVLRRTPAPGIRGRSTRTDPFGWTWSPFVSSSRARKSDWPGRSWSCSGC